MVYLMNQICKKPIKFIFMAKMPNEIFLEGCFTSFVITN